MARRRPVPIEWREDNHWLTTRSHAWGNGFRRTSRTRGQCSCGTSWPDSPNANNLDYQDVLEAWKDHVEEAYYESLDIKSQNGVVSSD